MEQLRAIGDRSPRAYIGLLAVIRLVVDKPVAFEARPSEAIDKNTEPVRATGSVTNKSKPLTVRHSTRLTDGDEASEHQPAATGR